MSGGNRSLAPTTGVGGSVARRSTISYDAKASSNEKTNTAGELPRYQLVFKYFWVLFISLDTSIIVDPSSFLTFWTL